MKTLIILGSTGSIGKNALKVIAPLKDQYRVIALASGSNFRLLAEQINRFRPRVAAIMDQTKYPYLKQRVRVRTKLLAGEQGIEQLLSYSSDIVLMAIGGSAALLPTLWALTKTKRLALANKESLVMAGDIIIQQAKARKVEIVPIDSEHSAIFQCLKHEAQEKVEKIYLTGSGGPLRNIAQEELEFIEPDFALRHPRWKMGRKISIDSATLMNKGFEVIEAKYLFGLPAKKIEVVIHPEAIVHSLVQFIDGTVLAQLGQADMRIPIQYALSYPERFPLRLAQLNFTRTGKLTFHLPDFKKFPCLELALEVAKQNGTKGCILNACDEECVLAYLEGKIKITDIPRIIAKVLAKLRNKTRPTLDEILQADQLAREKTKIQIAGLI